MTPEQAIELDENPIWQAFKRGETIEHFGIADGIWRHKSSISPEIILLHRDRYRIKQERFPEPPDGEQWHNPANLTPEQVGVKDGWRLALVSEVSTTIALCGKVEMWRFKKWDRSEHWICDSIGETYRTREPLPQKLRMVLLGPEDVPPGSEFRCLICDNRNERNAFALVCDQGVVLANRLEVLKPWVELQQNWLIKRPGEDWQKCEKPA